MSGPNRTALSAMPTERPACPHWVTSLQGGVMSRNAERNGATLNKSVLSAKERSVTNQP